MLDSSHRCGGILGWRPFVKRLANYSFLLLFQLDYCTMYDSPFTILFTVADVQEGRPAGRPLNAPRPQQKTLVML